MKKIIALSVFLSLVFTASAFALDLVATDAEDGKNLHATSPVDIVIGKCSKGVRIAITFDDSAGTAYALSTVHKSGSKYYGTAFDSTKIYVLTPTGDINAAFAAPATSVTQTAFVDTGWSEL